MSDCTSKKVEKVLDGVEKISSALSKAGALVAKRFPVLAPVSAGLWLLSKAAGILEGVARKKATKCDKPGPKGSNKKDGV
jgi:hypothetical protein